MSGKCRRMRASHIKAESTEYIKLYPGTKECLMDAFYVRSNLSPKDDMAHDADYIIDNFTNW